jgi:choline kinase|tara:strand:- start:26 stop:751 length:726 start_codon:yes stop_codon:yes gene_type:complete
MKAIILAAGRGKRMKKHTSTKPKCLIEYNGKPLIKWQIEAIKKIGINEIGIVTGYSREMLSRFGLFEFHNSNWEKTNMVYSLNCSKEWLMNDSCIVSYSDIFYKSSAISLLEKSKAEIAITYDPNWQYLWKQRFENPLDDAETFRLKPDNTLAEIGNKPLTIEEIEGQYMGLLKFTPKSWHYVTKIISKLNDFELHTLEMTEMLQKIIDSTNIEISAISYKEKWFELDHPSDLGQVDLTNN